MFQNFYCQLAENTDSGLRSEMSVLDDERNDMVKGGGARPNYSDYNG